MERSKQKLADENIYASELLLVNKKFPF